MTTLPRDTILAGLIAALTDAADRASDPDEKTELRETAGALGSIGKGVLTEMLASYAAGPS